ncbi:MAG TPA: alpha/beta fold hydrolase [Burkholderiales bacterium]|nr:alpha/beta fold hydrolase [Burkholderiales bacterium]
MPQVDVNGIKIDYRIDGKEGAPYVTFVTGIANDHTLWDPQVEALGASYRILRYDLRGHGDTQATEGDYAMELLVRDLTGLLNELNIQKTHLVGLGLGGAIVQSFAIGNSHRVNALVPCCCRAKMVPEFAAMWHKLREAVAKDGVEAIVEPTVQRWFSEDWKAANPKVLQNVRNMIRGTTSFGYLGVTAAFLRLDIEERLKDIKAPTLYVSGAEDKLGGPPELMAELAKKVRGAEHKSVPKAAHIANLQNPAGFNAVVGEFLKRQK